MSSRVDDLVGGKSWLQGYKAFRRGPPPPPGAATSNFDDRKASAAFFRSVLPFCAGVLDSTRETQGAETVSDTDWEAQYGLRLQSFNRDVDTLRGRLDSFCPVCAKKDSVAGSSLAEAMDEGQESRGDVVNRAEIFRYGCRECSRVVSPHNHKRVPILRTGSAPKRRGTSTWLSAAPTSLRGKV